MSSHKKDTRPCIVVILSDDHGYADRSILGIHPEVQTPALDRLAQEGTSCTEAYVTSPICSPSRAAIMSGHHQRRWGSRWFSDSHYPDHLPSLAEHLGKEGYRTGYLGKVHYGAEEPGDPGTPDGHGFEETFYGLAGQQFGRLNYMQHSVAATEEYGPFASQVSAVHPMIANGQPVDVDNFLTAEIGERACSFIEEHAGKEEPFFLFVAFNAVHNFCWQLPPEELERRGLPPVEDFTGDASEYEEWYSGQISPVMDQGRDYYLAQLELMDDQIGRVLDKLNKTGIADNTMVLYLTDNGGGHCNFASNKPLRGGKYTLWEGGIRVPFIVRWPDGGVLEGRDATGAISSVDILPTLLTAAGSLDADTATPDGVNLLPVLRGRDADLERTLHWDTGFQWAIRKGAWKLVWSDIESRDGEKMREIDRADPGDGWRLHDLLQDPAEAVNLVDVEPQIFNELRLAHDQWLEDIKVTTS